MIKGLWWKGLAGILLLYAVIVGFIIPVPMMDVTMESLRNVFYHVGMWFGMFVLLTSSFIFSLRYLMKFKEKEDIFAVESVNTGLLFGLLGIITGMIWAKNTWGDFWVRDPKLDGAAVGLFIYLAYTILRGSIDDVQKRAKVSAVYNILAYILWIVFVLILPRTANSSIHPGQDGAPIMALEMDSTMRLVFYPAMVGWILLGIWIMTLRVRIRLVKRSIEQ
jgi:heme exporter protein C